MGAGGPGKYVVLSVTDTGSGMDQQTQSRIFEPFFTTKEKGKGTGLGLATVYGIVQNSGGRIEVESQPGVGSTFRIYLPCCEAVFRCSEEVFRCSRVHVFGSASPGHLNTRTPEHPTPCAETILVVEDEPILRKLVQEVLKMNGYAVLEAIQGEDALRLCDAHEGMIDLLLTDVMMPGMSGAELAARTVAARPETKVLFMSGYADDTLQRHGVRDADSAFIQKPFKPAELAQKVRDVLRGAGVSGQVAAGKP